MRKMLWIAVAWLGIANAQGAALQPFVATYEVTYRGLHAGALRMELRHDPITGHYTYETRARPSMLARLVVSSDAVERTEFEMTDSGIRPLHWHLDDGKSGNQGDGDLKFDWTAGRVTGTYEGKPVDLPTQPGLQDRLSMQLAVTVALMHGHEPRSIVMVNGDDARDYTYTRGATAQLDTKLGKLETIVFESTRPGSSRLSRVWHAPSLGYLPVRAEQLRKGKVETVMTLVALERRNQQS